MNPSQAQFRFYGATRCGISIKWAIEEGCKIYDFRGVAGVIDENNPLFGLYRFKHRFDGTYIEFMGEMDLITKPTAAKIVDASQKIMKKLR